MALNSPRSATNPSESAAAVILAAGLGTRLRSPQPKVLHDLAGRPMVAHVAEAARRAGVVSQVVVIRPGQEAVAAAARTELIAFQDPPLGTAHAVQQARGLFAGREPDLLILYGDTPVLRAETLRRVLSGHRGAGKNLTVLTCREGDVRGMGRILRGTDGEIRGVVEEAEATAEQRAIREWNTGVYCARLPWLWSALEQVTASANGEFYLTDIIAMAAQAGSVHAETLLDAEEVQGINTWAELCRARATLRRRVTGDWLNAGVHFEDPDSAQVDLDVDLAVGSSLGRNVQILGKSVLGEGARIGDGAYVRDSRIGEASRVGDARLIGARLAAGAFVGSGTVIVQEVSDQ